MRLVFDAAATTTPLPEKKQGGGKPSIPHIRALAYDTSGRYLLSAGDDKAMQLWDCDTWSRLQSM